MTEQAQIDTLRTKAIAPRKLLIDGQLCDSETGQTDNAISPLDGSVLTTTAAGSKGDTERAIAAARRAFDDKRWRGMPPAARKKIMLRWAELIEAEMLDLAVLGVRNNGTEIGMALKAEPGSAIATLRFYAEAIDKVYGEIAPPPGDGPS